MKRLAWMLGFVLFGVLLSGAEIPPWPDRAELRKRVIESVEPTLKTYHPESGKFGTEPWICDDQKVIFPLAVAWATPGGDNPWYHSAELLSVIARAGEVLTETQDKYGRWIFRKKDNSEWGMIHKPWVYTRWIRAYLLLRESLPPEAREAWETGLKRGYNSLEKSLRNRGKTHNIAAYHAAGLYAAGIAFQREDWKKTAAAFMHAVIAQQAADGFWSEHFGPVVNYNFVYLDALGIYYHYSRDPKALEALARGARFHASLLWPDGTSAAAVDERNPYSRSRHAGNVGFSFTPEGRWYLRHQTAESKLSFDTAASMLLEGGSGPAAPPVAAGERYVSRDGCYTMERAGAFAWCFSAYACGLSESRWIMDRQNHLDLFHEPGGLIAGGGNTKMQPLFSSFTFGDPLSFQPDYSTTSPAFAPATPLRWMADKGRIDGRTLLLSYGPNRASIKVIPEGDALTVEYRLLNAPDAPAEAHLPLWSGPQLMTVKGTLIPPAAAGSFLTGKELEGGVLIGSDLAVKFPPEAKVYPAVTGFHPYQKYGKGLRPRPVIALPLSAEKPVARIRFERVKEPPASLMLWNGDMTAVRTIAANCPAAQASFADGALRIAGKTAAGKSMYLRAEIRVPTFVASGSRLSFELEPEKALPGDRFYIKGIGASGKIVFCYVATLKRGEGKRAVVLTPPGPVEGFERLDKQIAAPPEEPILKLEVFYGRTAKDQETAFRLRDLRVETVK